MVVGAPLTEALDANNTSPGVDAFAITPSDTVNFTQGQIRAIYCGGTGNIALLTPAGNVVTFVAVPTGAILPVCAKRVNATNTTATNLVGLL